MDNNIKKNMEESISNKNKGNYKRYVKKIL